MCMIMHVKVHMISCCGSSELRKEGVVYLCVGSRGHDTMWNNEIDECELHMHHQQTICMVLVVLVCGFAALLFFCGDFVPFFFSPFIIFLFASVRFAMHYMQPCGD